MKQEWNIHVDYPLVSVVIPNYNGGRYLRDCFDSLMKQTYQNIEIFFSDNHSEDDSYDIAYEYRKKFLDKGIFFRINENRNKFSESLSIRMGLGKSEGELCYILAGDDMIAPEAIEKCVDIFMKYPDVAAVIMHRREIDTDGNTVASAPPFYNKSCIIDGENQAAVHMTEEIGVLGQTMARSSIFSKTYKYRRPFVFAWGWYLNFLLAMFGKSVAFIDEPLYIYRVHTQSNEFRSQKSMMGIFEYSQMLDAFRDISKSLNITKPATRYDEAVRNLGRLCLCYALNMLKAGEYGIVLKYLKLAPVFKMDIERETSYKELQRCLDAEEDERKRLIECLNDANIACRTVSYEAPEGLLNIHKKA